MPGAETPAGPSYPAGVIRWRNAVVAAVRREWPGAVELDVTAGRRDHAGARLPGADRPAAGGRPGAAERDRPRTRPGNRRVRAGGGGARAAAGRPRRDPATWSRRGTRRCRRPCSAPTSRDRRTTRCCGTRTTWAGCRWSWPTCTRPCPRAAVLAAACACDKAGADRAGGPVRRDAGRRGAAGLVLPDRRLAAGGRLAGRHGDGRPGVRRGPGDGHRAHRPARGAARAGRRR